MISADCDSVRDDLDAFVDGELRGDELRYVSQHVDSCRRCAEEVEVRRAVGGLVRESAAHWYQAMPRGLASGVVTRVRAESSLSWRAMLNRAVEDWHWVMVGGGALTATFVVTMLCSLALMGTTKPREDSLSALGTSLKVSPGAMYAEVSRQGATGDELMLVQLETGAAPGGLLPALTRNNEERRLVDELAETLGGGGPLVELASMTVEERKKVELLMDSLTRVRHTETSAGALNTLRVIRLHLVTNTEVTAKGLKP